ncbi:MAG TPA: nitrate reductase associated protein [Polyangiaceae bacterium]|nr:nitrate reductase associated protein [Polyangiaceae bacterium]
MTAPFAFETEIDAALTYMPLALRYRLDRAGLKASLAAWQALPPDRRRRLLDAPAASDADVAAFALALHEALAEAGHAPSALPPLPSPPPWRAPAALDAALAWAGELGLPFAPARWNTLDDLRRYALYRLSASRKSPDAFRAALGEFGLLGPLPDAHVAIGQGQARPLPGAPAAVGRRLAPGLPLTRRARGGRAAGRAPGRA